MIQQQLDITFARQVRDKGIEKWVPCPGLEGFYEVSDFGRVRSLDRVFIEEYLNRKRPRRGQMLRQNLNNHGYDQFTVKVNGKVKCFKVHRLIAIAFIPNPENKPTVNHKNGVRHDNMVENLEWATLSEQQIHSYGQLGKKAAFLGKFGSQHNKSKAIICVTTGKTYGSIREAERDLGVHNGTICAVLSGRLSHAGGYLFRRA